MKEAAAWRKLGEWCVTHSGWLCWHLSEWSDVDGLWWKREPIPKFRGPWKAMEERISAHSKMGDLWDFFGCVNLGLGDNTVKNLDARVEFCELMALECEDEGNP